MGERRETRVRSLVAVGILSALVFVFSWVQVPFGDVARIHLGNGFCALAGLLFGPVTGGLASGIGSMLFDLTDPVYIAESPITFVTKYAIGFVAGCIARRGAPRLMRDVTAAAAGSFAYVALYLAKSLIVMLYIEGQAFTAVEVQLAAKAATSCVNALAAVVIASALAQAMRPALRRAHLLGLG